MVLSWICVLHKFPFKFTLNSPEMSALVNGIDCVLAYPPPPPPVSDYSTFMRGIHFLKTLNISVLRGTCIDGFVRPPSLLLSSFSTDFKTDIWETSSIYFDQLKSQTEKSTHQQIYLNWINLPYCSKKKMEMDWSCPQDDPWLYFLDCFAVDTTGNKYGMTFGNLTKYVAWDKELGMVMAFPPVSFMYTPKEQEVICTR